jgi:hypothetical protein
VWFSYEKATELLELNDISMRKDKILSLLLDSTSQRDICAPNKY